MLCTQIYDFVCKYITSNIVIFVQKASEKFRKYDLPLTQNANQSEFNMMLQDDVSKVNSLIYSNVMCLSNNAGIVEQQFSK